MGTSRIVEDTRETSDSQRVSDVWVPVCPVCKTQTITALRGQHRCLDCDRVWDGTERARVDIFAPLVIPEDEQVKDDVTDILAFLWRRGRIEEHVNGHEAKPRDV